AASVRRKGGRIECAGACLPPSPGRTPARAQRREEGHTTDLPYLAGQPLLLFGRPPGRVPLRGDCPLAHRHPTETWPCRCKSDSLGLGASWLMKQQVTLLSQGRG